MVLIDYETGREITGRVYLIGDVINNGKKEFVGSRISQETFSKIEDLLASGSEQNKLLQEGVENLNFSGEMYKVYEDLSQSEKEGWKKLIGYVPKEIVREGLPRTYNKVEKEKNRAETSKTDVIGKNSSDLEKNMFYYEGVPYLDTGSE